jgi:hypothetical protein
VNAGAALGVLGGLLLASPVLVIAASLAFLLARGERYAHEHHLDEDIVYLRAFGDAAANAAYDLEIEPLLACFGRPVAALSRTTGKKRALDRIMGILSGTVHEVGSLRFDDATWRDAVANEIRSARVVVVDVSRQTESLEWEVGIAMESGDAERLILLSESASGFRHPSLVGSAGSVSLLRTSSSFRDDLALALKARIGTSSRLHAFALKTILRNGPYWRWFLVLLAVRFRRNAMLGLESLGSGSLARTRR